MKLHLFSLTLCCWTSLVFDSSHGHCALASLLVAGMMSLGVTCASIWKSAAETSLDKRCPFTPLKMENPAESMLSSWHRSWHQSLLMAWQVTSENKALWVVLWKTVRIGCLVKCKISLWCCMLQDSEHCWIKEIPKERLHFFLFHRTIDYLSWNWGERIAGGLH